MERTIKAGIIGGAGYTGGEMIRLLLHHPFVDISFVHSRSNAGAFVYELHRDLVGETELMFAADVSNDIDVLFLCVGHGEARLFLEQNDIAAHVRVIDLSQDFRLVGAASIAGRKFIYGLPEYDPEKIASAANIANAGCFATAIQLALLPLADKGLVTEMYLTGITGATGAGQKLQNSSQFAWRTNNIQAYKSLTHQHVHEIRETLGTLQPFLPSIHFVPWRGDFARGIYVSACGECSLSVDEAYSLYDDYYQHAMFTHVSRQIIDLKQVVNTNKCLIHLEKENDMLVIHSAIDNLLKGASGQAVQNMNIMMGVPEDAGLRLKAAAF